MDSDDQISANLELQVSELELLRSMYPGDGELVPDDPAAEEDIRQWLESPDPASLPPTISFKLSLRPSPVEVRVEMGRDYPGMPGGLLVHVRGPCFDRDSQARLNERLKEALAAQVSEGELAVGTAVSWVQDNWAEFARKGDKDPGSGESAKTTPATGNIKDRTFSRLWIYSHHIYSKTKRKNILDLAPDHNLTGFCMPGKPGIICLEGSSRDCQDAWAVIKSWNWKKINVKIQEDEALRGELDLDGFRRFPGFEEVGFVKNTESRDYHMDMGEFFHYLKRHESDYMFKEFFGINKVCES